MEFFSRKMFTFPIVSLSSCARDGGRKARSRRTRLMRYSPFHFIVSFVILVSSIGICKAQVTTATVTGEISDATGAVVAGASVTMTNEATGIVYKSLTNEQGLYRISGLQPGDYRADVAKEGFGTIVRNGIQLHVEDVIGMNFSLQPGSTTETVTVQSGAPLLDTQSTSLGETIEGREVQEAPLNGRNPMNLVALVPGVIAEGLSGGNPTSNQGPNSAAISGFGNYQIGGGLAGYNAVFIDGGNENAGGGQNIVLVPTQDSVAEFHVDTNAISPQFGGYAGGVINFSTKSGGNDLHGTAYDYVRNTILDANTFWNDRLNAPVPVLHQNQFGAALGGPIVRNKTFFFLSWEQTRLLAASTQQYRVPTQAEINGDFTAAYGTAKDGILDYGNIVNGAYSPAPPELCPGGGINKICPQHLSSVVQQMYRYPWFSPVATDPAQLALLQAQGFNSQFTSKQANNAIQLVGRVDHQITPKQNLFLRYTYWDDYIPLASQYKLPAELTQPTMFTSQQVVLGDNYAFSPSLNGNLRLSYNRWRFQQHSNGDGNFNLAQFGANWASLAAQTPYRAPILLAQNNWANEANSSQNAFLNYFDNYALSSTFIKVQGHHSFTFGGEARLIQLYNHSQGILGTWNFPNGIAEFVTGIAFNTGSATQINNPESYSWYQGYYFNDSWQVTPKLSVSAGLRWELPGAWYEKHNHNSVLLPDALNPLGSFANPVGGPSTLKGMVAEVAGPDYSSRTQGMLHYHLFDPRVGINYSIDQNTVIRAGFGISHPCLNCGSTTPDSSPLNIATTPAPAGYTSIDNPFPTGLLQPLLRSTQLNQPYSAFRQTLIGTVISGQEPYQNYAYVTQWNLAAQRSLGHSSSLLLSYSGSGGYHLPAANRDLNALPDQYLPLGSQLVTKILNPFFGIAQPGGRTGGTTANYGQFLTPYPEFIGVQSAGKYYGQSSYNAFSAVFQNRFKGLVTLNASYTWSHFLTNVESSSSLTDMAGVSGPQDYNNPSADWSNATADIPQTLTVNYILDLPFGKGKRLLRDTNGFVDRIVSGWTISGISLFQNGFPLQFQLLSGNTLSQNFQTGTIRPNVVPGVSKKAPGSRFQRTITPWFNTTAFTAPPAFGYGNESRVDSALRADGIKNWDMNLEKNTTIREKVSLQFRAEYYNVFNHPQYQAPVSNFNASNFGQVMAGTLRGQPLNQPRIGQLSLRLSF